MRNKKLQRLLTQQQYATHLGVSRQRVNQLVKAGKIPSVHGRINPVAADAALTPKDAGTGSNSLAEAERRKMWALVGLRELELRQAEGKMVTVEEAGRAASTFASNIRSKLLALPSKMAVRLVGLDQARIKAALDREIYDVLTELSEHAADGIAE